MHIRLSVDGDLGCLFSLKNVYYEEKWFEKYSEFSYNMQKKLKASHKLFSYVGILFILVGCV